MKKLLRLQIVGSFEGINPSNFWPCDDYIQHMRPESHHASLSEDYQKISPEDSDYGADIWDSFNFEDNEEEGTGGDELYSLRVSGLCTWEEGMSYLSHIGAIFEDVETMGTLGGPLAHWCPAFSFRTESQLVLGSIYVTPYAEEVQITESTWGRIKGLMKENDPYRLKSMGAVA